MIRNKTPSSAKPDRRRPNRYHGRVTHDQPRPCGKGGCPAAGEFRAPKSRMPEADGYHWFCLDHVREYNENWNFFEGLEPAEASRLNSRYATWDRPTWPLGYQPRPAADMRIDDILGLFADQRGFARFTERRAAFKNGKPLSHADLQALTVLGLDETAAAEDIRTRYKTLLKRYHPDTNGGDRSKEDALSRVIAAYNQLASS